VKDRKEAGAVAACNTSRLPLGESLGAAGWQLVIAGRLAARKRTVPPDHATRAVQVSLLNVNIIAISVGAKMRIFVGLADEYFLGSFGEPNTSIRASKKGHAFSFVEALTTTHVGLMERVLADVLEKMGDAMSNKIFSMVYKTLELDMQVHQRWETQINK
jgi:hypothetical protein